MLKFNQIPPTAETTEVDATAVWGLAYANEDRCINGVAEVCASIVVANQTDVVEIRAIGDKIANALEQSDVTSSFADADCFLRRYNSAAEWFIETSTQ